MQLTKRNGTAFYRHPSWTDLRHGIFTRDGGVSAGIFRSLNVGGSNGDDPAAVRENHRRMYRALDVAGERAATAWLVHSADVLTVDEAPNGGPLSRADGLITNQRDLPLVMRFADCVPLLLYDAVQAAIGLGHAGWRGTLLGMASSLVASMFNAYGSRPGDIQALIGPAISLQNYPVGAEVAAGAIDRYGAESGVVQRDATNSQAHLDLWRANELDLRWAGVENVDILRICTSERNDLFFSHRAERGRTGRFGVVMSL